MIWVIDKARPCQLHLKANEFGWLAKTAAARMELAVLLYFNTKLNIMDNGGANCRCKLCRRRHC